MGLQRESSAEDLAVLAGKQAAQENICVWEEIADAVKWFSHLTTQWRPSFGGLIGLDYAAADTVATWLNIDADKHVVHLRIMEQAVLEALAEKGSKGK